MQDFANCGVPGRGIPFLYSENGSKEMGKFFKTALSVLVVVVLVEAGVCAWDSCTY